MDSMSKHVRAMLDFQRAGAEVFDYGNNIRQQAYNNGVSDAFEFPGFVPAYIRPLFCEGKGPFRWVALSGDKEDIYATDEAILELFPEDDHLRRWLKMAREKLQAPSSDGPKLRFLESVVDEALRKIDPTLVPKAPMMGGPKGDAISAEQLEKINVGRYEFCDREETAIQNIIDEIVGQYLSTLYKLKFLA